MRNCKDVKFEKVLNCRDFSKILGKFWRKFMVLQNFAEISRGENEENILKIWKILWKYEKNSEVSSQKY